MVVLFDQTRLLLYTFLSHPISDDKPTLRVFRFGIPLVMKCSPRLHSTESHALGFLHSTGRNLPIPRVVDTLIIGGHTYTVMTRIKGITLGAAIHFGIVSAPEQFQRIAVAVRDTVLRLWSIEQCEADKGRVMLSASGDGLPDPAQFFVGYTGPYPSVLQLYFYMTPHLDEFGRPAWTAAHMAKAHEDAVLAVTSDAVSWVHPDLRVQNIIVHPSTGDFMGIVDWEDSGWRPRHWQVFGLRHYGIYMPPCMANCFRQMRFPDATELAWAEMFKLLMKIPV
ncbi:kinase-like protein [Mucidula mucida]|nr:kinase-like protein [Mucidula mucida]